jgi:Spy/CpxP family protein refolding chaperone
MRNERLWLASGLVGALVVAGLGVAQGPGKGKKGGAFQDTKRGAPGDAKGRPPGPPDGFAGRGGPGAIERALDDLKLTDAKKEKAEAIVKAYQENLRKLLDLAKSDLLVKMKDILSDEELKTFTAALDRRPGARAFGGRGGRGPGGPGARGPGGSGGRGGPAGIERALDDLKLTDAKKDKAEAAVKAYRENVTKLRDLAKSDLLVKMKDVLSAAELKTFTAALDRPAGPGDRGGQGGRGPGGRGRGVTADQMVERLMSFDKNGDGKITKDELPERMQFLIELGDTNKDGALDKEEIKKLAARFEREGLPTGFGGPGAPGGRGPGGRGSGFPGGPGGDGFRGPGGTRFAERALDGLNLTGQKKEKAEAVIKTHEENVRKLLDLAKSDLLQKMKGVLSEQELKNFEAALERPAGPFGPGGPRGPGGPDAGPGRGPGDRGGPGRPEGPPRRPDRGERPERNP